MRADDTVPNYVNYISLTLIDRYEPDFAVNDIRESTANQAKFWPDLCIGSKDIWVQSL